MNKLLIPALAFVFFIGCTAAQEKGRIYRDAAEKFTVPDKVRVCYDREGDTQRGYETRCFGAGCKLPACPE